MYCKHIIVWQILTLHWIQIIEERATNMLTSLFSSRLVLSIKRTLYRYYYIQQFTSLQEQKKGNGYWETTSQI